MNTVCLTYIYQPFWGTEYFMKSCEAAGIEVFNACKTNHFQGHAQTFKDLYAGLLELRSAGVDKVVYADGADSVVFESLEPPDKIIYQTEKACYPHNYMAEKYKNKETPWCYLNGGGWCGPTELLIEYFERFGLTSYRGDINGQHEHMLAYFQALDTGFPIELDQQCEYYQSVAFKEEGEFEIKDGRIHNLITKTIPQVIHGNGRTDLSYIYEFVK